MMREICFLSGSNPNCPSQRFRVEQYLERFRRDGIAAGVRSLPRFRPARLLSLLRLQGRRTVVLHRPLLREWELRVLRRCAGQLVFDFDDALPDVAGASRARQERLRRRLHATAAAADRIVAGNPLLASAAVNGTPRAPGSVLILPTPVDTDRFCPAA